MLAGLAAQSSLIRATFDEASAVLGYDLWQVVQQGPEERLNATECTQPAMLAAGVSTWRLWLQQGGPGPSRVSGPARRFEERLAGAVASTGVSHIIEWGPGKVLTGLNRRIDVRASITWQLRTRPRLPPRSRQFKEPYMLKNDVALVTGASRGIGTAIAMALAGAGAKVIGTSTTPEGAAALTSTFASHAYNGRGAVLDVGNSTSIEALLTELEGANEMPTILVNNAAIARDGLLLRMKQEDWDEVIATNLTSVFRLSKACLRRMVKERHGRIVNLTSIVGLTGNPGQANYAAAKAGLLGFTKSLAKEVASRGITVNAVAPGFIDTDMTRALKEEQRTALLGQIPMGRLGSAADIAGAVLFLVSPQAAYITGETLHVNGGMLMA